MARGELMPIVDAASHGVGLSTMRCTKTLVDPEPV